MAIPRATVLTQLGAYGPRLQELNQGQRRTTYIAAGATPVDQGFCAGFCLDWVRKVILGGANTYQPKAHKTEDQKWDTEQRQTLRAATVHVTKVAHRTADNQNYNNAAHAYNELNDLITWAVSAYNGTQATSLILPPSGLQQLRQYFVLASATVTRAQFLNMINDLKARRTQDGTELQNRADELSRMVDFPVSWRAFLDAMDAYVTQRRALEGKVGGASRPFNALEVTTASPARNYANPGLLANAIVNDPGMANNRGSVFGMDIIVNGSASGHAVAAVQSMAGRFLFMDPNYGIFNVNTLGMRNAVQYLFGTVYTQDGWVVPGGGNYAIFQRAA